MLTRCRLRRSIHPHAPGSGIIAFRSRPRLAMIDRRRIRARLLLLAGLLLALPVAAGPSSPLVVVVRHAEKAAEAGADPGLSEAGHERARALADALADTGVASIVTSGFSRTRDTAAPLAARRGLPVQAVATDGGLEAHVAAVAAAARAAPAPVLVVGHSNTVPAIIAALGGPRLPDLADDEYDRLFVLVADGEQVRLVQARYGPQGRD
jgi:broad specificity phosphatase PhoE